MTSLCKTSSQPRNDYAGPSTSRQVKDAGKSELSALIEQAQHERHESNDDSAKAED